MRFSVRFPFFEKGQKHTTPAHRRFWTGWCAFAFAIPQKPSTLVPPEPPGAEAGEGLVDLIMGFPGVDGEPEVEAFQLAALVAFLQQGVGRSEAEAFAVHRQEAVKQGQGGVAAVVALEPEVVRAQGADFRGVLVLHVRFLRIADPEEEAGEVFVGAALRQQPADLGLEVHAARFETVNPLPVRGGDFVDKGGNHADLSVLGPSGKYILFCHTTQQ